MSSNWLLKYVALITRHADGGGGGGGGEIEEGLEDEE